MELRDSSSSGAAACGFVGKEDLYGLGIRLGVYIQTLTLIISGILRQKGTTELLNLGGLYQFALLFGVVYATINMDDFYACEAVIMTVFSITCMGINPSTFAAALRSPDGEEGQLNFLQRTFSPLYGTILRYSVIVSIDAYQVWLWFVGLDKLLHTPCTRHTFFLTKVDMYNGFRTFAKVYSVFIMIVATAFWTSLIRSAVAWKRAHDPSHDGANNSTNESSTAQKGSKRDGTSLLSLLQESMKLAAVWAMLVMLILATLAVELTIRWSHVHEVYSLTSVGQIIPLIMSLGGFISVLVKGKEKGSHAIQHTVTSTGEEPSKN